MFELVAKEQSGFTKIKGLINAGKAYPIFLKTRFGIHTFGLKFSIDVLILNQNNKVVKLAENLKPNRIFLWNPIFDKVIELPGGEVNKCKIKLGDVIKLEVN